MEYLVHRHRKKNRKHIWDGKDTMCQMYSTGGLGKQYVDSDYIVVAEKIAADRRLCHMCSCVMEKVKANYL
jgi:hypothetical protein